MPEPNKRLSEKEIETFLMGAVIYVFDPDTLEQVARVTYRRDGHVAMEAADGSKDVGAWGLSEGMYWTQYAQFREGQSHAFYLEPAPYEDTVQAYFSDGERAFLQSHRSLLKP